MSNGAFTSPLATGCLNVRPIVFPISLPILIHFFIGSSRTVAFFIGKTVLLCCRHCFVSPQVYMAGSGFRFFFDYRSLFSSCKLAASLVYEPCNLASRFCSSGDLLLRFERFQQMSHIQLQKNDRVIVGKEYTVEANDSLMSIAKRFGTTVDDLVCERHAECCINSPGIRTVSLFSVACQCRFGTKCAPGAGKRHMRHFQTLRFCKLTGHLFTLSILNRHFFCINKLKCSIDAI